AAVALALWGGTWYASTSTTEGALRAELDTLHPEQFDSPEQLERIEPQLFDLQRRARDFDSSWVRETVFEEYSPEVDRIVHAWSRTLGELLARDQRESELTGLVLQDRIYRRLVALDASLCPDCPYNKDHRSRGLVVYPLEALQGYERALTRMTLVDIPSLE